jgi:bifunctional DNase/RNase
VAAGAGEVRVEVVGIFEQEIAVGGQEHRIPVLILRDPDSRELRVPIDSCEGLAIQIPLERHVVQRPYTHDLAVRLLEKLSAQLESVVIDAVSGDTSHATLHARTADGEIAMDARAGDAVAIALRAETPIFVATELLDGLGADDTLS